MQSKKCTKCSVEKPISEFYKRSSGKYGVEGSCKLCRNEGIKRYQQTEAGQAVVKKAQKKFASTEKGKANQHRKDHSEKGLARRQRFLKGDARKKWNEEYYSRPEVRERLNEKAREFNKTDSRIAYMRIYNSREDVKEKKALSDRVRRGNPLLHDANLERARELSRLPSNQEAKRKYRASPSGKAVIAKATLKHYFNNPAKAKAHQALRAAIRDGTIARSNHCEVCGVSGILHGHHDDYAHQLKVRWLCPQCHKDWHRLNGPGING